MNVLINRSSSMNVLKSLEGRPKATGSTSSTFSNELKAFIAEFYYLNSYSFQSCSFIKCKSHVSLMSPNTVPLLFTEILKSIPDAWLLVLSIIHFQIPANPADPTTNHHKTRLVWRLLPNTCRTISHSALCIFLQLAATSNRVLM